MKRIRIAICLIAVAIALCVSEGFLTRTITEDLQEDLTEIADSVVNEDLEYAEKKLKETSDAYKEDKSNLAVIVSHDNLEVAQEQFSLLESSLKNRDYDGFFTQLNILMLKLEDIKNMSELSIDNLL